MDILTDGLTVVCDDPIEVYRAQTLLTKEAGTIQWLRDTVQPADVVYDIGANIGIYTLFAARLVGAHGHVYAFEPHVGNAAHLLRNVRRNGFADRVSVLTVALDFLSGYAPFGYRSLRQGSSGSQCGHTLNEDGTSFTPAIHELKYRTSIDALRFSEVIPPPTVVKVDVDGNELAIVKGMERLLRAGAPIAIQVETHPTDRAAIARYFAACGYRQTGQHYTQHGLERLARGDDPASITDNTVYTR